ncbi:MAG: hypothetical protein RL026_2308 [Pseudomonadota bacterium]|jgi:predicted NAD/FAD-dependent oxidoreductase
MRVAVVGAGMAGAACAQGLAEAGHEVLVFEKSRGLGGRLATRRGDGWQVDHGAPAFEARSAPFRSQLDDWSRRGIAGHWRASGPEETLFVGTPRQNAPVSALLDGIAVERDWRVTDVQRSSRHWVLTGEGDRSAGGFDALVLAVPPEQARVLFAAAGLSWPGELAGLDLEPCWAVLLRYAHPLSLGFEYRRPGSGPVALWARDSGKPGRAGEETWILHSTAGWARQQIETSAAEVCSALVAWTLGEGAPEPVEALAHRWRYATGHGSVAAACHHEPTLSLGLCGDWLAGGGVEGAWLSGRALAQRLVPGSGGNR